MKTGYITVSAAADGSTNRGGGGDNERRRTTFKPTGLLDRPRIQPTEQIESRLAEQRETTKEIEARIAGEIAGELRAEREAAPPPIERMSLTEIDAEIGVLLRQKMRSQEDETVMLLLMAAAAAG